MKNLPPKFEDPFSVVHKKINDILGFLEEKYPQVKEEPKRTAGGYSVSVGEGGSNESIVFPNGDGEVMLLGKTTIQSDEPTPPHSGMYASECPRCTPKSDEPKCCKECKEYGIAGDPYEMGVYVQPCKNKSCPCHKPHWESDYAAIWENYINNEYGINDVRQDILELMRKLAK